MTKIQIFLEMLRDASLLANPGFMKHVHAVGYLMLNADRITNYITTTDIPMESTIADYLSFAYNGGPKPRLLEMNGL